MALSVARKTELAAMALEPEDDMRRRIRSFMLRAGLNTEEMGRAIGYSYAAMGMFLRGSYDAHHPVESNSLAMRAAAKEFMDMHDMAAEFTFKARQHKTKAYREIRASALTALEQGAAYLVDGPPGTEKTYTLRQIEREVKEKQLGRAVYVYARIDHSPQNFLRECCIAADLPSRGDIDMMLRKLRFFLANERTLLMVDEAQHLCRKGLEVLRQLLDLPPHFGVILAGSHDLTQRLSHWQMEQWRSRLRKTHYLNGPSKAEASQILRAELGAQLTDAQCEGFIARCMSTGQRTEEKDGTRVAKKFTYISARDLFNAIESIQLKQTPELREDVVA